MDFSNKTLPDAAGDITHFSLSMLLALLVKNKRRLGQLKSKVDPELLEQPALQVLQQHHQLVYNLQIKYKFCFVFLHKTKHFSPTMVYDGSRLPDNCNKKCVIVRFDGKGRRMTRKLFKSPSSLPRCLRFSKRHVQHALADLLNIAATDDDNTPPHDYDTTKAWLQKVNLWNRVTILYCTSLFPKKLHVNWITALDETLVVLEAFIGTQKTLAFAPYSPAIRKYKCCRPKLPPAAQQSPPVFRNTTPSSCNMSSAVSTQLKGLTGAFYLGLLSAKAFKQLTAGELTNTFGALWIHLDGAAEEQSVIHLAYTDYHREGCQNFQISSDKDWKPFFDFLWQRHNQLCLLKKSQLGQLMEQMKKQFEQPLLTSKHSACLAQLNNFCAKTRIVVFATGDSVMHALKKPFAAFAQEKKKSHCKGLRLKTNDKNTIVSLSCAFMQIDNIAPLFAVRQDQDFLHVLADWVPPQHIFKVPPADSTVKGMHNRGGLLANMLHRLFTTFCQFIFKKYCIDLHTWPINSLTSLAFQTVWIKYAQMGGPLLHAPEKTKPYYEQLMRTFSRGGFSWSLRNQLNSGDPLGPEAETAKSICEYDICSSYGYAASQMKCPGGFCVGYVDLEDNGKLQRTDKYRYKHFEFQATFKFIHDLHLAGAVISAVYSNYHALGILYLGKYPVDLCVTTKNRGNFVVQFDQVYTHGCGTGCHGLFRYSGNKTRPHLEQKTQLRDTAIQQWVDQTDSYTYVVVSECHTPGYKTKSLAQEFVPGQPLYFLVEPYLQLPRNTFNMDQLTRLSSDLTYTLFCQGHAESITSSDKPPLFVWNDQEQQDFSCRTAPGQNVMLSQLHYEYLCREHNFKLDSVKAILFYKTDPFLPRVFQQLTQDRYEASHSPSQVAVIKCLINFACGYFGYNADKKKGPNRRNNWLVSGFDTRYPFKKYTFEDAGDFNRQSYFVKSQLAQVARQKKPQLPAAYLKASNSALPIFCTIIDVGKMRLGECLTFIQRAARPGSVKLLYTHIDNVILACSESRLEEAVAPKQQPYFQTHRQNFLSQEGQDPLPGQLKLEFNLVSDCWKFASPKTCFYGLINGDHDSHSKTSSLNSLSHQDAYRCALQLLNKTPVKLTQERRVNKLSNTLTQLVHLQMKPNK
jgi:hypothetical protein